MIARSDLPSGDPSPPAGSLHEPDAEQAGTSTAHQARLTAAIAVAGVGALLVAFAPLIGLVSPHMAPAFPSWPLLLVLAAIAPVLAMVFARGGKPGVAAAVLIGSAVLAPGRLALDSQLVVDAALTARPELLVPHTLDPLTPSGGLWFLLVGHVATGVGGVLAAMSGRAHDEYGATFGSSGEDSGGARKQGLLALVLCAAVAAAVGVLMAPFVSVDPYLLPSAAVDSSVPVLVGALLVAIGVPVAAGFAASSADPERARGGLLGLSAAVAGVVVPSLFAVMILPRVIFAWGPLLALLAAVGLAALALPAGRAPHPEQPEAGELGLPALARLLTISGVAAVLAGALAIVGGLSGQIVMPAGLDQPSSYPARMLLPAGAALFVLGVGLLVPRVAVRIRPAMSVAWAVLPLSAAAALDTVFTALQVDGAHAGLGPWAAGFAAILAIAAGVVAAVAGGVERDDVDLTESTLRRVVAGPSLAALLLGVAAFSFPVVTAAGYTPPGVFTEFGLTSWGLVIAMLSVVVAAALAPRCRPAQATALLCGAALVVLVRVLEFPLTSGRAVGAGPGLGFWIGLTCIVALLVAAVVAARGTRAPEPGS